MIDVETLSRLKAMRLSGMAEYFGIDANLIRVIVAVLTVFTGGFGALAYLAAWVVVPEEGEKSSIAENLVNKNTKNKL